MEYQTLVSKVEKMRKMNIHNNKAHHMIKLTIYLDNFVVLVKVNETVRERIKSGFMLSKMNAADKKD